MSAVVVNGPGYRSVTVQPASTWLIYRAYDAAGDLLYIGRTGDLRSRLRNHKSDKAWWAEVVRVDTVVVDTLEGSIEAERHALLEESPRYNVQLAVPRMVPLSFRVPADSKDQGYAKAAEQGRNPTEVMRDLWVAWAAGDE